jgi:uncharacterized lipoprotein YmbA
MRGMKSLLIPALAVLVAGCASSPASHYYTLLPAAVSGAPATAVSTPNTPQGYLIGVQPVQVPDQLDRLQIVITDPASTQVMILSQYLWASRLSNEIRNALSDDLSGRLGVIDVSAAGNSGDAPTWKIGLGVQRFESVYGQYALLDATWKLTPVNLDGKRSTVCRASTRVSVQGEGMSALVAAHQEALQRFGAVIASQLQTGGAASGEDVDLKGCSVL